MPPRWIESVNKPNSYTEWTKLVSVAEGKKNLAACRKVYDAFLMQFPLAHIYWRKYAETVNKIGTAEEAEKVYIRAVKVNPLNIAMWVNYISYVKKTLNMSLPESQEKLDRVIMDAVDAAGSDYLSDGLWNLCIEWVIKLGHLKRALALMDRLLCIPTQQYQYHFMRLTQFVSRYSPVDILSSEELEWIYSNVQIENEKENDQVADEDCPPEDIIQSLTESEITKFREHIIKSREQLYLLNEEEVKKRCPFEREITIHYFNALPINVKQLQSWRRYLDFEISQGLHDRIVILYERCLMSCTLYEDFWLSYARYMENYSIEFARSIYERACLIHLPKKVTLHLRWAEFEEKHGRVDAARIILCNTDNMNPGLAMVRLRRVNLERRNGNLQEAERLLREAVQYSLGKELAVFYSVKLARLLLKLKKDPSKARDVITEALQKEPDNICLHQCLLEIEMSRNATDDAVLCVEKAVQSNLHIDAKRQLLQRLLQFLEDYGSSVTSWLVAFDKRKTLLPEQEDVMNEADECWLGAFDKHKTLLPEQEDVMNEADEGWLGAFDKHKTLLPEQEDVMNEADEGDKSDASASTTESVKASTDKIVPESSSTPTTNSVITDAAPTAPTQTKCTIIPPHRPLMRPPQTYYGPPRPMFAGGPFPYRQPCYMGGPSTPFFTSQEAWRPSFGPFNVPPPWGQNRFYPPF
ncbi:pre-mRNA-processing factor 39-like isoform X2 [Pseudophryne corroboree]